MGNDTKQKLIETAIELIWRESYNAVSVDDICKKADVKKGSFYHFFSSKADLALQSMDSCMEETKIKYDDLFSPTRPALERIDLMCQYVIDQQKEISKELGHVCGCPFATLGSELAAQNKEFGEKITNICDKKTAYYESALRTLVSEDLIPADTDVKVKAQEIFSFIVGLLITARISDSLEFLENNLESGLYKLIGINTKK